MSMSDFFEEWGWWLAGGVAVAVLLVLLAVVYFRGDDEPAPAPEQQPAEVEPVPAEDPGPEHPLPEAEPGPEPADEPPPLPPLETSDASFTGALAELVEAEALRRHLTPENVIPRLVVTIDNLPREQVALRLRAITPVPGLFRPSGGEEEFELREEHFERYEPLVQLAESIDIDALVGTYRRYYPLFQKAYADLGYPSAYFNDRLVEVIDHLLDAPAVEPPIALTRPHVLYEYADPDLEALSAGQKVLIRIGPDNAEVVKEKLREIRAAVSAPPEDEAG
ncbi:MAG TPA: DUF3014 domain-containing protein [Gammaproteobacteria bacterium]|nr:DUF3014 domain-containing protein [Gammaproteobacteria bacterium]